MYLPAHFAETRPDVLQAAIRDHPFGLLVTHGGRGLTADGIPFVLDADDPGRAGTLRAHVARANPLWRDAVEREVDALVVFQGAQAYVSPAWYASKAEHGKVVPTWNYILVQARGRLRAIDDAAWLHAFVARLTDRHEAGRVAAGAREAPAAWSIDDAPADYTQAMLRAIVGVEVVVDELIGKWKVSQNRPAADTAGVVRGLDRLAAAGDADAAAMAREVEARRAGG